MGELLLRMVFSLAVVVGLLILISRVAARRLHGRAGSPIEVLHRQALSKSASVSVVSVAGRVLVLGSTDQQVNVLTELDADAFGTPETVEARDTDQHTTDDDLDDPLATELTDDELATLLAGSSPSYGGGSLEALLAEPDRVTLEELLGHRPPSHAAPVTTPAEVAAGYAEPTPPAVAAQDEEDPYLPEDPSYAAFASALRAQLASGALGDTTTTAADPATPAGADRSGRHAAPAPAMELPPVVAGGARVARTAEPAAAPAPAPVPAAPSVAAAPSGPSAADLAALRAALLSAQLQAGTTAPTPTTVDAPARTGAGMPPEGALSGSVLSPQTWRQAYRAVTRRAS
ncbi:hypothetical protein GCM10009812_06410 [Nocardioides marinus]|uniref:Flagellar biogenesis protein FliO n=2 Tax=Nocardioides marinus TaxID=374514 RepID=A0A7Y9YAY9_9ACTN|nr:flagellar biosynthetic protein FliO [Nocardioides marinus]NYI08841.1 flagellar biogenesis protein FliO [Nocardioides marinus]